MIQENDRNLLAPLTFNLSKPFNMPRSFLTISAYVKMTGFVTSRSVFHPPSPFLLFSIISFCPTRSWDEVDTVSFRESMCLCPMITSRNFLKRLPCNGFVKQSASICSVGQYCTSMCSRFNLSFMKKYWMSICREFGPQDLRPFFSNLMVL